MHSSFLSTPDKRVHDLKKLFGASSASAAHLLCDRYDADRAAYHILDADLDDRVLS